MEFLDNRINKKIISGCFPDETLYPDDDYFPVVCNFEQLARNGLKVLNQYPESLYVLFGVYDKRVKEMETINRPELYEDEVNVLINTGYSVDDFDVMGKLYSEACKLCPAVTSIDKVLWYGIRMYYFIHQVLPDDEYYSEHRDMMFALIYLLKMVQKKEIQYKCTINIKSISAKINILKLIESDWDKVDKKFFSKLTDYGIKRLKEVNDSGMRLSEKVAENHIMQKEIADKTETEWRLFLSILNDLSSKEKEVIFRINRVGSPKDKGRIISGYQSVLRSIEREQYIINGEEVNLFPVFYAVSERLTKAPVYCTVKTDSSKSFQLHPAAFNLVTDPKTFNYLFITFHEFRLTPRKDTAKKFVALALSTIKKNLGEQVIEHVSLDEMIRDFYQTVTCFVNKHSKAIERLSFESLRKDSAVVTAELSSSADSNGIMEDLARRIKETENSDEYDKELERIMAGGGHVLSENEVAAMVRSEEERKDRVEQEILASRIVVSLNIIYMLCDALRIMLNNRHVNIKFKNREAIEQYRRDLLRIDEKIVHRVYANLSEQEMGMLEYREKNGIISTSLSEQETEEEKYRNSLFGEVLKNSILTLVESIEKKDAKEVLRIKSLIREEIIRFPDCDEKDRYTDWLDNISKRISDALVAQCQNQDDFQKIKNNILSSLGEKARILPDSTVNSLTTAEMLYARYASEEYVEKGFDFSCVSALYYQAFEEAYNLLIWRGYADELNVLEIDGQKYTDILYMCRKCASIPRNARGYLDPDSRQRSYYYYIDYKNTSRPETKVSTQCMYKSFAILLKNINPNTKIEHFCEYIAKITGFRSCNDMFNDSDFMRNCSAFTAAVYASTGSRNNASHGGTFISVQQCRSDQKTVLNELEVVRSDSLGLIQQLIFLLKR